MDQELAMVHSDPFKVGVMPNEKKGNEDYLDELEELGRM